VTLDPVFQVRAQPWNLVSDGIDRCIVIDYVQRIKGDDDDGKNGACLSGSWHTVYSSVYGHCSV